jgi:hypothetical protein
MDDGGTPQPATRQRSRGPGGVLAAAVALVLVFVAVRLSSAPSAPARQHDRADPTPVVADAGPLFDVATRGTLAGDAGWVSGVAGIPALDGLPPERHVALATDAPEERIALVLGRDAGRTVAAWLIGASGAPPEQMAPATAPLAVSGSDPLALWDVPPAQWTGGLLVVVAHPDDAIAFLPGHSVAADGSVDRVANRLPTDDGITVAPVGPPPAASGGLVLVDTGRGGSGTTSPLLSDRARQVADAPVEPADPRRLRAAVDERRLQSLLHDMVGAYGIAPPQISPILLAAGPVGDLGDQAVLVGATLPSGATVAWLGVAGAGPGDPQIRIVPTVPAAAGTALLDRVVAVPAGWAVSRLPLPPGDGPPGWLVISGPRTGTTAQVLSPQGDPLATLPLVDGAGVGPVPQGTTTVRVLDADGAEVGRAPVAQLPG